MEMEAEPSTDARAAAAEPAANADAEIDPKSSKRWRVEELRAALEAVGASTEGHKPALVERLVAARTASGGAAMEEEDAAAAGRARRPRRRPTPRPNPRRRPRRRRAPVPEPTPELDPKKLKRLKVEELRAALESLGRSTEGHKPALVERLAARTASGGAAMEEEDAAAPAEPRPRRRPTPRPNPRPRPRRRRAVLSPRRSSTRRSSSA